jgi:predicted O-methyltransferase YrrM
MTDEPTTPEAIDRWITSHLAASDEFADVAEATEAHRVDHDCDTFAGGDGPLLRVLAAAIRPRRVLEVGTALGYSGLHLAAGAGPGATLDSIEVDPDHASLARRNFADRGMADRVTVHVGLDAGVLATMPAGYDLIVYDAAIPGPELLDAFDRLLAPTGSLISSNLFLGRWVPDDPRLPAGAQYRERLFGPSWRTAFIGGKALSVRA